jgi:hypothetical protein
MDTSKTYIKMCDCKEIQGQREVCFLGRGGMGKIEHGLQGDFYYGKPTTEIVPPFVVPMPLAIWLPRQDQLQEMVEGEWDFNLILALCNSYLDSGRWDDNYEVTAYCKQFTSMEQLWLAFVLKERHSKIWDGDKWIMRN